MNPLSSSKIFAFGIICWILSTSSKELPASAKILAVTTPVKVPKITCKPIHHSLKNVVTFTSPPQVVSLNDVLENQQDYHQQLIAIHGIVKQPELHLDESELYIDFVFRLEHETHFIIVYGRHDRTLGPPAIRVNEFVEVIGTFFKEQDRDGSLIFNVLEALSVAPYPSSIPEST